MGTFRVKEGMSDLAEESFRLLVGRSCVGEGNGEDWSVMAGKIITKFIFELKI
jgi:hypothetical protein